MFPIVGLVERVSGQTLGYSQQKIFQALGSFFNVHLGMETHLLVEIGGHAIAPAEDLPAS